MAKVEGLRISRKYSNGTVHENGTGKLMVLDRYLNDDNEIMLKFQWMSGEKAGEVEENKEVNINASCHKFQVSRGIKPVLEQPKIEPFNEKIDEMLEIVRQMDQDRTDLKIQIATLVNVVSSQQQIMAGMSEQITILNAQNSLVTKQQGMMEKLIDKMS